MKTEKDVRRMVSALEFRLKKINENSHRDNPLIYSDEKKEQLALFADIELLYWVLEEPIPAEIFALF